ncbi:uncharacterized protein LOC118647495 [Monomorium pharaonis]|uniref:uncharacterized protein LOC118647495 n=1 Tax=Monomorium pharaonis TaxID=307658 RepID=UPI00174641C1|nr:uncharacterized protein LOC118647495 [Monomorium pharaonis]
MLDANSNEAINYRIAENSDLDLEIIQNLEQIMRESNVFAQSYQMMSEELENQRRLERESGELLPELQLLFTLKPGVDRRRYNAQRTNEVAAVFRTTSDGEIPESYVTIRNKNTKTLQNVSTMDPNVEPWIVDKYISAEIPDPCENRTLHDIVMRHMIHGPCGDWCLIDGKCSKHYPKPYLEETRMDEDAYPYYRRRNNNKNFERPGGYGHDAAAITIEPITDNIIIDHDEIRNFIETRYVGPVEACWRILEKKLQDKSHTIARLPIHLPNEQNVIIENETIEEAMTDAACLALGLIEDDEEWKRAMNEAIGWMMPQQLRRLFHCQKIMFDILDSYKDKKKAYSQINTMLCAEGKSLADFPQMEQLIENDKEIDYMTLEETMEVGTRQYEQLNDEQKEIVDLVLNRLDTNNHNNNCIYIDGPGGSGKTFIYTTIYYLTKIRNKHICTMAFTGIAATLLPVGKTVHKTFGLPVPLFADSSSNIKIQSKEAHYLKEIDIFIWDEAPMAPRYALEIMDRTLRDIMNNDLPFGGKIIVLGGDFRQLLPIKVHGTRSEIVNLSIKFSSTWKHFINFSLTKNTRVLPEKTEFAKFLLDIGDGKLNDSNDNIQLPDCCIAPINADIVQDIYGDLIRNKEFNKMAKCAILSARNADVDKINKRVVELLNTFEERIYTSIDSTENCGDNGDIGETLLPEYLNTLSPSSLPPYELRLRPNSIIMLIRNLSINEGLCNGTRLMIIELADHLLKCKILTGDKVGDIVFLNRITLYCENVYPFTFKRRQFPIKLAFAMTINKSQGQTFDRVGIDLRKDVFNHGQLYVAFSRTR